MGWLPFFVEFIGCVRLTILCMERSRVMCVVFRFINKDSKKELNRDLVLHAISYMPLSKCLFFNESLNLVYYFFDKILTFCREKYLIHYY